MTSGPAISGPRGAIGVFDSGIGGLTVYKALRETLPPSERLLYLGDTARVPYGTKSDATVVRYALEGARFLARRGVKALVVACNTMSAIALDALRREFPGPVVGVIEPGVEAACAATRGGTIGVIGTAATIKSGAYARAIAARRPGAQVVSLACPLLVPLAEEGWVDNDVAQAAVRTYLRELATPALDTLVLGCTHYPLLRSVIAATVGPGVVLVDSAEATAGATRALLAEAHLLAPQAASAPGGGRSPGAVGAGSVGAGAVGAGAHPADGDHFHVTDSSERFLEVGSRFLGRPLARLELVDLQE
ncbi:MAG TPA: glutamate racemase [Patescibacteria group bacterium]|nr:glutamate racemase [Patescibacteria group bacterium]